MRRRPSSRPRAIDVERVSDHLLVAPLMVERAEFGAIAARRGHPFGEADVAVFDALAHGAALAIASARQRDALEHERAGRDRVRRAMSAFCGGVAHDLRTPLNGLLGFAELLEDARELDPTPRQWAKYVAASARQLNALLEDMADFANLEAGTLALNAVPTDVAAQAQRVATSLATLVEMKQSALDLDVAPLASPARIDPARFRQVLHGFLSYALRRAPAKSRIAVRVRRSDRTLLLEVEHGGPGLSASERERLLQPLGQLGLAPRSSGVGLSLTRAIVEAHGGEVTVLDGAHGGACFRATFREAGALTPPAT